MTNFSDMLSKAKAMQEKMKEIQEQIKKMEVEGVSGGNLVKVTLSGDYELKSIEITEAAKKENQEVINEIQIGNRATLKEYANDLWINTQAKGLAAKTVGLRVVGYNFETIQGKVYIAGITSRPEQLEDLINAVKTIKGVKEIVNYVIIKEN